MGFEEGSYVTNLAAIQHLGLNKVDVSSIVAKIFCEQMWEPRKYFPMTLFFLAHCITPLTRILITVTDALYVKDF